MTEKKWIETFDTEIEQQKFESHYRDLLESQLDQKTLKILRGIEKGVNPVNLYVEVVIENLPTALREIVDAFDAQELITNDLIAERIERKMSPSLISNRLKALEESGILVKIGRQEMKRGGRRYVYQIATAIFAE